MNMKNLLTVLLLLIFISSCDKQKQSARKLAGTWELASYKVKNAEGLSTYATGTGIMHFDECTNNPIQSTFTFNATLSFPNVPQSNISQQGTYEMIEKGDYMTVKQLDNTGTEIGVYTYRILVLTKTDLELEYPDNLGNYVTLIFSR
jgi:hypothetical protein